MDEQTLDSISGGGIGAESIGFVLYVINRTCKPVLPSIRSIKKTTFRRIIMNEQLMELTKNEVLINGLVECQSPAELMALLKDNNIELDASLTAEEAFELVKNQASGELATEDLDAVSGGLISLAVGFAATRAFILAGGALCFLAGYAYETYKKSQKKK